MSGGTVLRLLRYQILSLIIRVTESTLLSLDPMASSVFSFARSLSSLHLDSVEIALLSAIVSFSGRLIHW